MFCKLKTKTMKRLAIPFVFLTTAVLITLAVFVVANMPFNWIFYLTVFGQAVWIFTVYQVLSDAYTTDKTFKDFYEDHPIGDEEF